MLHRITAKEWDTSFPLDVQQQAIQSLENGQILFLPELAFPILTEDRHFVSTQHADPKTKNISYHAESDKLWGVQRLTDSEHTQLKSFLSRYSHYANSLIKHLLPHYADHLMMARTSFRPIEVSDRKSSYRKDDKRLHIDAFPSAPNHGKLKNGFQSRPKPTIDSIASQALSVVKALDFAWQQRVNKMFVLIHIVLAWQHVRHDQFAQSTSCPEGIVLLVDLLFVDNHYSLSLNHACLTCNDHKVCDNI